MSKHGAGIINRLHPLSPLHDKDNDGRKVIDSTIGEYLDRYEAKDYAKQLFLLHATGRFLDLHGDERGVKRKKNESDDTYRARILLEKNMYNCISHFRRFGVDFWDYVEDFAEGSQQFYVRVYDEDGFYVENKKVYLTCTNNLNNTTETYETTTLSNGYAIFNMPNLNHYTTFNINIPGDRYYNEAIASINQINNLPWRKNTILSINDSDILLHRQFKIKLTNTDGTIITGRKIIITVNGISYPKITDDEGYAKLNINLPIGTYEINYIFEGDEDYNGSHGSTTIHDFTDEFEDKKNQLIEVGVLNDISSTTLTSKNTYLNKEYYAHSNLTVQRKLQDKFINKELTWF